MEIASLAMDCCQAHLEMYRINMKKNKVLPCFNFRISKIFFLALRIIRSGEFSSYFEKCQLIQFLDLICSSRYE